MREVRILFSFSFRFRDNPGGGGGGMSPWCIVLAALIGRSPFAALPTLSLHRRWCPSASHQPVSFLFLLALSFPLYFPFLSFGLSQGGRGG